MQKTKLNTLVGLIVSAAFLAVPLLQSFADTTLNGAGATFPFPIYSKWFDDYHKAKSDVKINYQSIGSGGGIKQFTAKTVDFGASDGPMTDKELFAVDGKPLHIPTVLGGVVITWNVPEVSELNLTGDVIAKIFMGDIKSWDDAAIKTLNPNAKLPGVPITVVHRADGSGTTYCFTDYLAKMSPAWKSKVGQGKAVNWPVGLGGKGNEGVVGLVKQTVGSIGYTELVYASQNRLPTAAVQNKAGKIVKCSIESVTAAAANANMPKDFRVSIVNAGGDNSYPIATYTWLLVYQSNSGNVGKVLKDFLNWMIDAGQKSAPELGYAPLPPSVQTMVKNAISSIK